jgi:DNA-binding LytR/AlgR family response regulator
VLVYFWLKQIEIEKPEKEYAKTISVKNGGRSVVVIVETIKWISSDGPYLFLHTSDSKHILSGSLKNIITILPENFKRIHRSTIVNINMIKELRSRMNGDYDVNMNDGTILRLSRNYTKPLKGLLLKSTHLI